MRPIGSVRFIRSKLGFAVLASALLAAGVSSAAFGAVRAETTASSCSSRARSPRSRERAERGLQCQGEGQGPRDDWDAQWHGHGRVPLAGAVHDRALQHGHRKLLAVTDGPAGPEPFLSGQCRVWRRFGLQPIALGRQARTGPALASQVPGERPANAVVTHGPAGRYPRPGRAVVLRNIPEWKRPRGRQ